MIPPSFDYAAPETLAEAISLLQANPQAKILAGGHSLIPMMRFRLASPALLIDINRLHDLQYIRQEDGWLKVGAMTRESALEESAMVQSQYPLLADTARLIADPLVRNLATLGGNLAHADPANDHPATMLAYNAQIEASGPDGKRSIDIQDFFTGPFETAMAAGEILTEIRIPPEAIAPRSGGAYMKLERKVGDYATAAVAVQLRLDGNGHVQTCGIGLTNVGLTPILADQAASSLVGKLPDDSAIAKAAALAAEASEPSTDARGSEEYKRALVKTLTARAIRKALSRAQGGSG